MSQFVVKKPGFAAMNAAEDGPTSRQNNVHFVAQTRTECPESSFKNITRCHENICWNKLTDSDPQVC